MVVMSLLGSAEPLLVQWSGHQVRTVRRWVNRFNEAGDVLDAPGRGRNRITSQEVDASIVSLAEQEKFITPLIIRNQLGVRYTHSQAPAR
jgi:transposase